MSFVLDSEENVRLEIWFVGKDCASIEATSAPVIFATEKRPCRALHDRFLPNLACLRRP
jgi:hypothetical protein